MCKNIKKFQIFSIIFAFVLGTLLHFTFNWYGENKIIAIFSSINESPWEHLKLVFWPILITTIIGYFCFKDEFPSFICAKTFGIIISMAFMITFFYTYTGVLGKNFAVIDIASFFLSVLIGENISYKILNDNIFCDNKIAIANLIILLLSFIIFTFYTPKLGIFKDPATGQFGSFAISSTTVPYT